MDVKSSSQACRAWDHLLFIPRTNLPETRGDTAIYLKLWDKIHGLLTLAFYCHGNAKEMTLAWREQLNLLSCSAALESCRDNKAEHEALSRCVKTFVLNILTYDILSWWHLLRCRLINQLQFIKTLGTLSLGSRSQHVCTTQAKYFHSWRCY